MKRPCLGSQIRIAKLYLQLGITYEEMEQFNKHEEMAFLAIHGKRVSKMGSPDNLTGGAIIRTIVFRHCRNGC